MRRGIQVGPIRMHDGGAHSRRTEEDRMTMPHERLRAIGWGKELLLALQRDPVIPDPLKAEAQLLARTYPTVDRLLGLIHTGPCSREFPPEAAQSIEGARGLFEAVQRGGLGCAETGHDVLFTLRHFPLMGWAVSAANAARIGRLDQWLAADPDRDGRDRERFDGSQGGPPP